MSPWRQPVRAEGAEAQRRLGIAWERENHRAALKAIHSVFPREWGREQSYALRKLIVNESELP